MCCPLSFIDMSEMAGHRVRYPSGGSRCSSSSVTRGRPKSASVIISKDKPYVSPYAQSGMLTTVAYSVLSLLLTHYASGEIILVNV